MEALFAWPGGKRNLRKRLLSLLPSHEAYVEVFAGSAKLLFAKDPSRWEIINDLNEDLLNFFRVAKHRPSELAECLERECIHASRFQQLRAAPDSNDELDRALRFAFLVWYSFGGKGQHFTGHRIENLPRAKHPVKKSLDLVRGLLQGAAQRLSNVLIEKRDFSECIGRYDSAATFFYCDPPYTSFRPNARYETLGADRNRELFELLRRIRGKFLLSYNRCKEIVQLAKDAGFFTRAVAVRYTLAGAKHPVQGRELLIANFPLPAM